MCREWESLLLWFVVLTYTGCTFETETFCAYSRQSVKFSSIENSATDDNSDESVITGELFDSNTTEKCPKGIKYCYTLWQEESQKTFIVILAQGCWDSSGKVDCNLEECIPKRPSKIHNNTKFCCCLGNMCNINVSDVYYSSSETMQPALQFVKHASYNTETVIIALATVCSLAIIIVAAFLIFRLCSASQKPSPDSIHLMEAPPPPTPTLDLDSLKIQETVGYGRYGHVCRGILHNHTVAVKIFSQQHRQNFINERNIYSLPLMDHLCLPKFIGAEERVGTDGKPEYLLVLSYAPLGCLQDYLRHNIADWPTLCKMAQTITRGLAHLHTEIKKGDKTKMCVAHRDLTSRNILVKSDGSCLLCDFGFAICISGSKYFQNGDEQIAETTSLADVGTLRYMAPEVLEGAVNLRDCESSLKQIDVYSLGLIIWEIATRCLDLFQGMEVPDYKLPFEAEVGLHPSMEQMQVLVARHKARPLFPDIWKDTNPAVRALKETIEDCWDQDAEARLTALCVEERLLELPILWERHKAGTGVPGMSPTVNPTNQQKVAVSYPNQSVGNTTLKVCLSEPTSQIANNRESLNGRNQESATSSSRSGRDHLSSSSENTAETSLTMSPSDPFPSSQRNTPRSSSNAKNHSAKNFAVTCPRVTVPLQPHQGRNPCMERNLMRDPVEEVSISGNTILEKGSKYKDERTLQGAISDADIFDVLQLPDSAESNALVSNDVLNHSTRACNPIPYVQNAVHLASVIPKQPNVPGNGHHLLQNTEVKCEDKKRTFGVMGKIKVQFGNEQRIKGLKDFLRIRKNKASRQHSTAASTSDTTPKVIQPPVKSASVSKSNLIISDETKNKLQHVETEVCVINPGRDDNFSQTVVRPIPNEIISGCQHSSIPTDIGVTKLYSKNCLQNGQPPLVKIQENCVVSDSNAVAHHTTDSNTSSNTVSKTKRPNTLAVKSYGLDSNQCSGIMHCVSDTNAKIKDEHKKKYDRKANKKGTSDKQKTVKRVKTPFEIKKGRFSLCDDRIMSSQGLESCQKKNLGTSVHLSDASKISISVPMDIDTLCESEASSFLQTCHNHLVNSTENDQLQQQQQTLVKKPMI